MSIKLFVNGMKVPIENWTFPGGERNVRISDVDVPTYGEVYIVCHYRGSDDLVDLILLTNAIRNSWPSCPIALDMPYFPFARQDRVMTPGEANAVQAIVQVINMLDFARIYCTDPHSDVLPALFPAGKLNCTPQWEAWEDLPAMIAKYDAPALVSPDAGAAKKIYKLAANIGWPVVEAGKQRNPRTGEITSTSVYGDLSPYDALVVVDDICDGGRTFIELAKAIRATGYSGKLHLCVSHGIFSKGIEVVEEHYDSVLCINDLRKE